MDTDLGGVDHSYLGLILADQEYLRIIPTPTQFQAPTWSGALVIDPDATTIDAVHEKEGHKDLMSVYRECKNVEKALLCHIQNTVEKNYVKHLIDEDTGLIKHNIPTILENLCSNYGKVPSEEVKQHKSEALNISFNPADPMVTLFWPIEQLQKLATAAEIP